MKFKVSGGKLGDNVIESIGGISTNNVGKIINARALDFEEMVEEKKEIPPVNVTVKDERPKNKEVEEAVEFDPSLIKKDKKEDSLFDVLSKAIDSFKKNYSGENSENKRSINGLIVSLFGELTNSFESEEDVTAADIDGFLFVLGELYVRLYNILEQKADEEGVDPEDFVEFPISDTSITFQKSILYNIFRDNNFKLAIETDDNDQTVSPIIYFDIAGVEHNNPIFNPIYGEAYDIKELAEDYIDNKVDEEEPIEDIMSEAEDLLDISEDASNDLTEFSDISEFAAEIINVKDVLPEKDPKKVMAIVDEDGEYITIGDNQLLVIDRIDNKELNKLTLVSKSWFNEVTSETKEEDIKEIPTGVIPEDTTTTFSVNGVGDDEE